MRRHLTLLVAFIAFATVTQAQNFQSAATAATAAKEVTENATVNFSQPTAPRQFPNIKIENFGQMDERFYRGSQPSAEDYKALKELGIDTVIDLRKDSEAYSKATVESLGMKYVNIPMTGWTTKDESVAEFLKVINDQSSGEVYVHCAAGKHRTGLVGAIYRLEKYGWDYDTAYKEMKNYKYFSGLFHRKIKGYVKDYYEEHGPQKQAAFKAAVAQPAVAAGQAN
jgi:protein tyrosine/serine phosphatase